MKTISYVLVLVLLSSFIFMSGCSNQKQVELNLQSGATASSLMPAMSNYNSKDSQEIMPALSNVAGTAAGTGIGTGAGAATKEVIDMVNCYSTKGAYSAKGYVDKSDLLSAGVVVIGDDKQIKNPMVFFACIKETLFVPMSMVGQPNEYKFCSKRYTIIDKTSNNKFYVMFAGTSTKICTDMCAGIAGCSQA